MATMLRDVLRVFETTQGPLSINEMARDLDITPGMLDGMIDYWVRKGKIRACGTESACHSCSHGKSCSYSPTMPRSYELVVDELPVMPSCCHKGK
jgi:hypothetical protein